MAKVAKRVALMILVFLVGSTAIFANAAQNDDLFADATGEEISLETAENIQGSGPVTAVGTGRGELL